VDGDGVVHKAERRDTCLMCRQQRIIVDESCCSACLLGRRLGPLRYECDGCHRVQLIAHPMYRYQRDPITFGTDTWACHAGCGTYTHWKVLPADADRIPPEECPESWGRRDEWSQEIRRARMVARMGNGAPAEERLQAVATTQPRSEAGSVSSLPSMLAIAAQAQATAAPSRHPTARAADNLEPTPQEEARERRQQV